MNMPEVDDILPAYPQPAPHLHEDRDAATGQEYRRNLIQAHFR